MEVKSRDNKLSSEIEERITNIYRVYIEEITPFIVSLEVLDGEYPVEIINEIRAIFTHISRCYVFPSINVDAQITAAERHIKRCKLDCYKYSCLSFTDYIQHFYDVYKRVDLTLINNGEFISQLRKKCKSAQKKINSAKQLDTRGVFLQEIDTYNKDFRSYVPVFDDKLFEYYELAYNEYKECYDLIESNLETADFLRRKACMNDIISKLGFVIGILGFIWGFVCVFI